MSRSNPRSSRRDSSSPTSPMLYAFDWLCECVRPIESDVANIGPDAVSLLTPFPFNTGLEPVSLSLASTQATNRQPILPISDLTPFP